MAEANDLHLYPHANLKGDPLPFDVVQTIGTVKQDFTNVAVDDIAIPAAAEIAIIYADPTYDCYIQFGAGAAVPADGVHVAELHYIPAGTIKAVDLDGATIFGVISADANSGTIHMEFAYKWRDSKNVQQHQNL